MFGKADGKEADTMEALIGQLSEGQELQFIIHGNWSGGDALIRGEIVNLFQNENRRQIVKIQVSELVGNNSRIIDNCITLSAVELVGYLQEKDNDLEASIVANKANVARIIEDGISKRFDLRLQQERQETFKSIEQLISEIQSEYDAKNIFERTYKLATFRDLEKKVKSGRNYKNRSSKEEMVLSEAIQALDTFVGKELREGREIEYEKIVLN